MAIAKVLVIDDEQLIRWSVKETLQSLGYEVAEAETATEGLATFRQLLPEVVFLDVRLPDGDGLSILRSLKEENEDSAVIVMTAFGEIRTAVEAMRLGAYDYLKKPFDFDELQVLVEKALETTHLRRQVGKLRHELKRSHGFENIIGESPKMQQVLGMMEKVAESDAATVLVQGENGTGKDLFARSLHQRSRRAEGPFMDISCTAMPESLFESELFGHERGAYTDAKTAKPGLLELADGGTLFLDEVGDMPLVSQAKILKVIETKCFKRLGGTVDHQADIRIVAATNRNLEEAVRSGRFREDLYYRLKVIPITLPPLRERQEDIPALLQHYVARYNTEFRRSFVQVSDAALQLLVAYHWPGNVRELRNLIERIMILEDGTTILPQHLPPEIVTPAPGTGATAAPAAAAAGAPADADERAPGRFRLPPAGISLEKVEQDFVRQSLEIARGNQTRAAQLLGISRDALRYRMQKFGFVN